MVYLLPESRFIMGSLVGERQDKRGILLLLHEQCTSSTVLCTSTVMIGESPKARRGDDLEIVEVVLREEVQIYILSYFKSVVHLLFTVDIANS